MNPSSPIDDKTAPKFFAGKRRLGAFVMVVLCVGGIWFFRPAPPIAASVTILPADYSIPAPPLPLPDRWIPPTWGPLWKLRYAVLGKALVVNIQTETIRFSDLSGPLPSPTLDKHPPLVMSNGVSAWILAEGEIKSLRSSLQSNSLLKIHGSRMTTGEGMLANLSMTTSPQFNDKTVTVGDSQTYAVHKPGNAIELSSSFVSSELVTNATPNSSASRESIHLRTNLTLAVIMRIPRGHGAFLFDTNRARPGMVGVGLVIEPKAQ